MIPLAEVGFAEATWILVVKSLVIFAGRLRDRAGADRGRAQAARPLPAPLRAQPGRALRAAAAARRRPQAGRQGGLPRRDAAIPLLCALGPALVDLLRRRDARDPAVRRRQRPTGRRLLRDRRLDRRPLLLRLRLDRLLRPAARRLGVGLEVQLPRRDALGRAADLLRDLDGPGAARRDHDGRLAVARPTSSRRRTRSGSSSRSSSAS